MTAHSALNAVSHDSLITIVTSLARKTVCPQSCDNKYIKVCVADLHAAIRAVTATPKRGKHGVSTNAYSPEYKASVLNDLKEVDNLSEVARTYGLTRQTIARWKKEKENEDKG